jgi:hypothetical protein
MTSAQYQKIKANIQYALHCAAKREVKTQLAILYANVAYTLAVNPHNTFQGTPSEYIRKHNLAARKRQMIIEKYEL